MSLKIFDTLVPQGNYPVANAADILMPDGTRLDTWKPQGTTEAAIFPAQELTDFTQIDTGAYAAVQAGVLFTLTAGTEYRVSYDGESHAVTAADIVTASGATITGLGNAALTGDYAHTGEQFYIYVDAASNFTVFTAETEGPHTIAIYQEVDAPVLPGIASSDEGKFLAVQGGKPVWVGPYFGDVRDSEVLLADQTVVGFAADDSGVYGVGVAAVFELTAGEEYRVIWDGTEYACVSYESDAPGTPAVMLGNKAAVTEGSSELTEPFTIVYAPAYATNAFSAADGSTSPSHTIAIYHDTTVVKTLDAKYLPMDAIDARINAVIEEALGGDY